jgi:hypothetical protein
MNLREAFLAASKPQPVLLNVEGIDADVYMRVLTVREILESQEDAKRTGDKLAIARTFARLVCNADNTPVYSHTNTEDVAAILELPWHYVLTIVQAANKVNGAATDREAVEKN